MKKMILVLAVAMLAFVGTAQAAPKEMTFYLNTAANDLSAVTGAAVGGVSQMVAEGMGYDRAKDIKVVSIGNLVNGRGIATVSGVSFSQAAAVKGGSNTGTSFFLYAAVAQSAADIPNAEKIAIYGGGTLISGDIVSPRTFVLPAGSQLAFFWGAGNGASLFSSATVNVRLEIPDGQWTDPMSLHLGTRTYLLSALTGTSVFSGNDSYGDTIPEGSRYVLIKSAESGNSLWITRRTAVDRDKDPALQSGDVMPVEGSLAELKRIGVAAAVTGVKAIVDFFTRKPF